MLKLGREISGRWLNASRLAGSTASEGYQMQFASSLSSSAAAVGSPKIGWIGLGAMGYKMLGNLVKAGHQIMIHDNNSIALDRALEELGEDKVIAAEHPAEMARTAGLRVIFTMLPSPEAVHKVYLGPNGILSGTGRGKPSSGTTQVLSPSDLQAQLLVDCSTVDPPLAQKIAGIAERIFLHKDAQRLPGLMQEDTPCLVDAPVTGGVAKALTGELAFMVGGEDAAIAEAEQYLKAMGTHITRCGDHGSGQAARLVNALVMASSMAGVAEGLALAKRLGVDPKVMTQVLNNGSGRSWASEVYNPVPGICASAPSSAGYQGGLSVDTLLQQLDMVVTAAEASHSPAHVARHVQQLYRKVHDEGLGSKDFSSVYRYVYGSGTLSTEWKEGEKLFNSQIP